MTFTGLTFNCKNAGKSAVPDVGSASQDVEGRFLELERNTLEAMMRATDQKSTQQPGESSAPSAGQRFDTCWLDHWGCILAKCAAAGKGRSKRRSAAGDGAQRGRTCHSARQQSRQGRRRFSACRSVIRQKTSSHLQRCHRPTVLLCDALAKAQPAKCSGPWRLAIGGGAWPCLCLLACSS